MTQMTKLVIRPVRSAPEGSPGCRSRPGIGRQKQQRGEQQRRARTTFPLLASCIRHAQTLARLVEYAAMALISRAEARQGPAHGFMRGPHRGVTLVRSTRESRWDLWTGTPGRNT